MTQKALSREIKTEKQLAKEYTLWLTGGDKNTKINNILLQMLKEHRHTIAYELTKENN